MIARHTLLKAALAATALTYLTGRQQEGTTAMNLHTDPKPPTQVPPGDLGDAVGDVDADRTFDEADGDEDDDDGGGDDD